jgi:hypothetical protein
MVFFPSCAAVSASRWNMRLNLPNDEVCERG